MPLTSTLPSKCRVPTLNWLEYATLAYSTTLTGITIAVLVNCEREPQYFQNLNVAKSTAAVPTSHGHMARVIDGSGNLNPKLTVARAARMVQPPHFEGPNVAVEALFNTWDSFRNSKVMWRPNPEMPRGDVMPKVDTDGSTAPGA